MSVLSQSSDHSAHSSPQFWNLNDRWASIMDSIYAIGAGLGLRFVVGTVSRNDFKISGTLVGLWEGIILLHFQRKMPKSTDPYVALGVRLFIDFLITESLSRLFLVLVWTAMGMILADVTPVIWEEVGLRRFWRNLRRDLYTLSEMIPTVVFFPPARTVRFSPSREPSLSRDVDVGAEDAHTEALSAVPPSVVTIEHDISVSQSVPLASTSADQGRRRLPGYFPGAFSDTESVLSSAIGHRRLPSTLQNDPTRTSRRQSMYPTHTYDSQSEASNDLDEMNVSSTTPSSQSIEETNLDLTQVTDIPDEEEQTMQTSWQIEDETAEVEGAAEKDKDKGDTTPKPRYSQLYPGFPPTPSDSQAPSRRLFRPDEPPLQPTGPIPSIPDMLEETAEHSESVDGWVEVQRPDPERPPTPPEKDRPRGTSRIQPPVPAGPTSPSDNDQRDASAQNPWKRLDTMPTTNIDDMTTTNNANNQRNSQPPPYADHSHDHDDIYGDPEDEQPEPVPEAVGGLSDSPPEETEEKRRNLESQEANRKTEEEEQRRKQEAERQRKANEDLKRLGQEAEARRKQKEEVYQHKKAEQKKAKEAEEQMKREQEAAKRKAEKEEREHQEAVAAAARAQREKELAEERDAERRRLEAEERVQEEVITIWTPAAQEVAAAIEVEEAEEQADADAEDEVEEGERAPEGNGEDVGPPEEAGAENVPFEEKIPDDDGFPTLSHSSSDQILYPPQTSEEPMVEHSPEQMREEEEVQMETESILTEQSEIPEKLRDRLDRVLLLKAQMIEIGTRIADLEQRRDATEGEARVQLEQDLQASNKVLRKMKKKEQRRWETETSFMVEPKDTDTEDRISFEGLKPIDVKRRLQEHLENLLSPDATSLTLTTECPPAGKKKNKAKEAVVDILGRFHLLDYSRDDAQNGLIRIDVPQDRFAEWLTTYRVTATANPENNLWS